jgi:hypothetical protein
VGRKTAVAICVALFVVLLLGIVTIEQPVSEHRITIVFWIAYAAAALLFTKRMGRIIKKPPE